MTASAPKKEPQHAAHLLALDHRVVPGRPAIIESYRKLPKFDDWLDDVRRYCRDPASEHARAAAWLLDNDYHIARASRRVQDDLSRDFYDQLSALECSKGTGLPRIYAVASAITDELQPQITLPKLIEFIQIYQSQTDLTNAELWALPSMLRLVCIERLIDAFGSINPTLAVRAVSLPKNPDQTTENSTEAIAQAISNLIAVHTIKWNDFVDHVSPIEAALSGDPADVYSNMTFETRDTYRKVVERLARRSVHSETDVARAAVNLCGQNAVEQAQCHVGYWLIGTGTTQLETQLGYRIPSRLRGRRRLERHSGMLYAIGLIVGVLIALVVPLAYLWTQGATVWQWCLGIAISLVPATILSVWVVHWIITKITTPLTLPEIDFSKGVPEDHSTAVVIPVLIGSVADVDHAVEKLENATTATNFLKAISHEGRLMILCHLATGEKSVTELEELLSARQAAVSQQLGRLRLEGLVKPRREGKTIFYSLADERTRRVLGLVYELFCETK